MKSKSIVFSLIIMLVWSSLSGLFAQTNTCSATDVERWKTTVEPIVAEFDTINFIQGDLGTVAELQELRRQLAELFEPGCDVIDDYYHFYTDTLNAAADSIVAGLIGDEDLAETLGEEAILQRAQISTDTVPLRTQTMPLFAITTPVDGAQLNSHIVEVEGTFDTDALADDVLWLFHIPSGGRYYPAADICNPTERNSLNLRPHPGLGLWTVTAYLGSADDGGGDYDLVLMSGKQEANEALNRELQRWCDSSTYPGFMLVELTDIGLHEVAYVEGLTR